VPVVAGVYERMAFHEAAHGAVAISSRGNLYLQETAPWTAFKKVPALYKQLQLLATWVASKCVQRLTHFWGC
jgi:methionyl-tRNA synthetase